MASGSSVKIDIPINVRVHRRENADAAVDDLMDNDKLSAMFYS
jgi:hypothetical protein